MRRAQYREESTQTARPYGSPFKVRRVMPEMENPFVGVKRGVNGKTFERDDEVNESLLGGVEGRNPLSYEFLNLME